MDERSEDLKMTKLRTTISAAIFPCLLLFSALTFTACGLVSKACIYADENNDHLCDNCGEVLSYCSDANTDHKCDICIKVISKCTDKNGDLYCDMCGKAVYVHKEDEGEKEEECKCSDGDKDHLCDKCGLKTDDCFDGIDEGHECDKCKKNLCLDGDDPGCACDVCGKSLCADSDKDHICDNCKAKLCYDGGDRGHTCDRCGDTLCKDRDGDHICDECNEYICVECEKHSAAFITVYAEGANAKVNGGKVVRFYGIEESYSVLPSYRASEYIIDYWVVYDESNTPLTVIESGGEFTPASGGVYYVVPVFVADRLDCITDLKAEINNNAKLSSMQIAVEPGNPVNAVLLWATNGRNGSENYENAVLSFAVDDDSMGDVYTAEFDYFLDYTYCGQTSILEMFLTDENSEFTVGNIEQTILFHGCENGNLGTPVSNAARIYADNSTNIAMRPEVSLSTDTWYTVRIVVDENTADLYVGLRGSDNFTLIDSIDLSGSGLNTGSLTAFGLRSSYCGNNTAVMLDSVVFGKTHDCEDSDADHFCDLCKKPLCYDDSDKDHKCDECSESLCCDGEISDHFCDECGNTLSNCADENTNHYCDICGKGGFGGTCIDGEDDDHLCDYCKRSLCRDFNSNLQCDICGAGMS